MQKNSTLSLSNYHLRRLTPTSELLAFDCGDTDLNEFFLKDASLYGKQLLAVTYTFETDNETIAFYSVFNDKIINKDDYGNRIVTNKISRSIPNTKRRPTYPAVKVGRLGVNIKYQKRGLGSQVLDIIKHSFTDDNKTGCRFITVDSYNNGKANEFYKKNGFEYLTEADERDKTRLMYYDLIKFLKKSKITLNKPFFIIPLFL